MKQKKLDFILLVICLLFYLWFPIMDGPVWCVDSNGYATMHITREPLYPLFLAFCRKVASILCIFLGEDSRLPLDCRFIAEPACSFYNLVSEYCN